MVGLKGYKLITNIYLTIENTGPLHIGTGEEEVLLDRTENKPYMPATGVAGALKAYIKEFLSIEDAETYFGSVGKSSSIFISDAVSSIKVLEKRPGLRIDPDKGSNKEGAKFDTEYAGAGHKFTIRFKIFSSTLKEKQRILDILKICIKAINDKQLRFGGMKTSGAGTFKVLKVEISEFDLTTAQGLSNYLLNKEEKQSLIFLEKDMSDIIKESCFQDQGINDVFAVLELQCFTLGPILSKGQASYNSEKADSENIKNALGSYIVPGSSLKGVLRAQCRKILNYLQKQDLLIKAFGSETEEDREIGRVYTEDIVIQEAYAGSIYHRIKIDKFTSGVMTGALMSEQPVSGKLTMKIRYKLRNDDKENDAIVALLSLAVRDLALSNLPLGSGSSIGRGRLKASLLKINYRGVDIELDLDQPNHDQIALINILVGKLVNPAM